MINKEDILKNFSREDTEDVIKVYECMNIAYLKDIPTFTKFFCKPNVWTYFIKMFNSINFCVAAESGVDDGDRKILSFNNIYSIPYPYKILKISSASKFSKLNHRDYLGALMALGIEREKLGDLRVNDDYAIVPVYEELADYICRELKLVNKAPVKVCEIFEEDLPKANYKEDIIIIPSLRVDNFVSKLANVSRGKAITLIDTNKVLVDYSKVKGKSQEIKEGQRITISGTGKFLIGSIIGNTKSGRYKINIKKYI